MFLILILFISLYFQFIIIRYIFKYCYFIVYLFFFPFIYFLILSSFLFHSSSFIYTCLSFSFLLCFKWVLIMCFICMLSFLVLSLLAFWKSSEKNAKTIRFIGKTQVPFAFVVVLYRSWAGQSTLFLSAFSSLSF